MLTAGLSLISFFMFVVLLISVNQSSHNNVNCGPLSSAFPCLLSYWSASCETHTMMLAACLSHQLFPVYCFTDQHHQKLTQWCELLVSLISFFLFIVLLINVITQWCSLPSLLHQLSILCSVLSFIIYMVMVTGSHLLVPFWWITITSSSCCFFSGRFR